MNFVIIMVLLLVVMYVLMIRPQRRRQQQQEAMVREAGVGDDILTTGGIYGTITQAEGDDVVVEIADGLAVHMTRRGIAAVLPPESEEDEEEAEPAVEGEVEGADEDSGSVVENADERAVTDEEEPVSAGSGEHAGADERR